MMIDEEYKFLLIKLCLFFTTTACVLLENRLTFVYKQHIDGYQNRLGPDMDGICAKGP